MEYRILLTGVTGLFGYNFLAKIKKSNQFSVFGISRKKILNRNLNRYKFFPADITTNTKKIINIIKKINPDIILHAASIGNVDFCETHKKEAWRTNVFGTRNIIEAAKSVNAKLVFFSTNAVYDGKNPPYSESAKTNPVDFYGKTKMTSEGDVLKSGLTYAIIRLMTMYGWHDKHQRFNPVTWMMDEMKKNHKLNVVSDIYNNHLYVGQAVEAVLKIIKLKKWNEVYNIAGLDCISRYQLAQEVADVFSFNKKLINPVKSIFFKTIAPRPQNTCFKTSKMERELKISPIRVHEGLKRMFHDIH